MYVETTYIKEAQLKSFNDYGVILFKDLIYIKSGIGPKLSNVLIGEVMKDKNFLFFDKDTIKSVVGMLIDMGLGSNATYREVFEDKYIEESKKYYTEEADRKVESLNIIDYLKVVEKRLAQEKNLCNTVIDISTVCKILSVIDECFIVKYSLQIASTNNVRNLLDNSDFDNLKLLYSLFIRSPKCILDLSASIKEYTQVSISNILNNEDNIKKPINTIKLILLLIEKLNFSLTNCFFNNHLLDISIQNTLEVSLNLSHRIAIYFAIFIDNFMRREIKSFSDSEIESEVLKFIKLFVFIRDRDIFEAKHKEFLANRLLEEKSLNIDSEKVFIKYIKQEAGLQYVSKIEGMINDMNNSENIDTQESFLVKVLTSSHWPKEKLFQINVSFDLTNACNLYAAKYCEQHTGRRLI